MPEQSHELDPAVPHWLSPPQLKRLHDARRTGDSVLAWKDPQGELHLQPLEEAEPCFIGRGPKMDISLSWDDRVSGLHARVTCAAGEWLIEDQNWSKNGTFRNEKRVDRSTRLRDKDVIRVGRTRLWFRIADGIGGVTTTALDDRPKRLLVLDETDRRILIELCRVAFTEDVMAPVDNKTIAEALGYGEDMVSARFRRMYSRANINYGRNKNRSALMAMAIEEGYVTQDDYIGS
jgi:hypothetical protein